MNKNEYYEKILSTNDTPVLIIDLAIVRQRFLFLKKLFPMSHIFYAMKANPHPKVLELLNDLGACFDVASVYELKNLLDLKVDPSKISFGNTIKKKKDIAYAFSKGIRYFTTDSLEDLEHIASHAPKANVFFRVMTNGLGADWPLSRKFGCHQDNVYTLALRARDLNLRPYGIIFHVGSQQRDIGQWDEGVSKCKYLFSLLEKEGIKLKTVNLGGGLPADYYENAPSVEVYAREIWRFLKEDFGEDMPEVWLEPGRYLVGDSGTLISEVILISRKSNLNMTRWVYLDVGKFNGLMETIDELIKYPIDTDRKGQPSSCILAGPTCDSMDILYEKYKYQLPEDLQIGDKVYIRTAGAYTQSYSSVGFNGFPPIKTIVYDSEQNVIFSDAN
ncbi:ornithine decarboxylase [PVC group bacterium (ex Bugula neritina AB1)]|nr:ornithine decarboxylase [PVC group bacterium (ex Bugula neritina AB1)]